eukprot:CAMPEP_0185022298 /NCGR_PEP_ID=MMETSP1103-20130426/5007_1 /TAXON_ID=36769 /ORGANISM="Paraphysomonas bandaiensis, Strain Caron Lab Isolate" /LENGTH=128 /DNA_ID=CAMNT_0027554297 /DNA_START=67 /DNA_END=453 /DNA_ORIENTATION=-
MSIYRKEAARSLIRYVSKIEMFGNIHDPTAVSVFELGRQMSSKHLKKANPKLVVDFNYMEKPDTGYVKVTYANGEVFEVDTAPFSCAELRSEIFDVANNVEYEFEVSGNNPIAGDDDDDIIRRGGKKK